MHEEYIQRIQGGGKTQSLRGKKAVGCAVRTARGFTLAEVLITLSIIGVVAALTIPAVTRKFEKQQYISQYKETISILSQAVKMAIADNGGSLPTYNTDLMALIKPNLKILKDCTSLNPCGSCFADSCTYTRLDGAAVADHAPNRWHTADSITLSNGVSLGIADDWTFTDNYGNCSSNTCKMFYVDINGKKRPNSVGKDTHSVIVNLGTGAVLPDYWDSVGTMNTACPSDLKTGCPTYFCGQSCGWRIMRGDYATTY
jgi:prepilin-type N-terminal cleavage/methylation domain-containing protein